MLYTCLFVPAKKVQLEVIYFFDTSLCKIEICYRIFFFNAFFIFSTL